MEVKKCVICYTTTTTLNTDANSKKLSNISKDTVLNRQLTVVFLLRKFFNTPQDICRQFLQEYGNPSEWIDWCNSCSFLVKRAKCVFDQIILLRKQFDALQEELKTSVQLSEANQQTAGGKKKFSRWGATEIIRACLTKDHDHRGDDCLEHSQSEVEFKIENYEDVLDIEDDCSLFVQDDDSNLEHNNKDPLDLDSEISFSESKSQNRRSSTRLKNRILSHRMKNSVDEVGDSDGSFDLTTCSGSKDPKETTEMVDNLKENETFQCEKCSRLYTSFYSLKEHFVNVHGELPISCEKCETKVLNKYELKRHNERYHKSTHTVSCTKCPTKTFLNERNLRQHCKKEHNKEYFEMFPRKTTRRHFATLENSVDCKKCGKMFVHLGSLRVHCRRYHAEHYSEMFKNIRSDTCDKCGAKFKTRKHLKTHYQKEHPKDFKLRYYEQKKKIILSCVHCPFKTFKTNYLQMHMKKHNRRPAINLDIQDKNVGMSVKSEVENTIFVYMETENMAGEIQKHGIPENNVSSLETQTNLPVTADNNRQQYSSAGEDSDDPDFAEEENISSDDSYDPTKQRSSPKQCKNKKLWKRPEKYNSLLKVSCPICTGKVFINEKGLRQHCRNEHPEEFESIFPPKRAKPRTATLENSISCKKCGNIFVSEKSLKAHCRNYHADDYSEMFNKADENTCDKCNKKFRNRREMKTHYLNEHPKYYKVKYYETTVHRCPHCPFQTINKTYLQQIHIDKHNNEKSSFTAVKDLLTCQESKYSAPLPESPPKTSFTENQSPNLCGVDIFSELGECSIPKPKQMRNKIKATDSAKDKRFKCEICSYFYVNVYSLKEHYLSLHGQLPLSCDKCDAGIVNEFQMRKHNERYHNEANKISCPVCVTKTFRFEKSLRMHCKKVHPEVDGKESTDRSLP